MDDLEIAYLVLVTASSVDGGCVPCVQGCVDEAIFREPGLPWEDAAARLRPDSRRHHVTVAVESSRSWINDGNFPRHIVDDDGELDELAARQSAG